MLLVDVLALEITGNQCGLGVARTVDLEGDVGGRVGLDLERCPADGKVPAEKVIRGLSKVLHA